MSDLVKVADKGHVRTITLNRAEKKNALSTQLAWGVIEAIEAGPEISIPGSMSGAGIAGTCHGWVVASLGGNDAGGALFRSACRKRSVRAARTAAI